MPLYACLCSLLQGTQRKYALLLASGSSSQAEGRGLAATKSQAAQKHLFGVLHILMETRSQDNEKTAIRIAYKTITNKVPPTASKGRLLSSLCNQRASTQPAAGTSGHARKKTETIS